MELDATPTPDVQAILSELRDRIDREHRRALQAHAQLVRYLALDGATVPDESSPVSSCLKTLIGYTSRGRSKRDLVFDAICMEWRSVEDIAETTQLTQKQVEGVVYAPDIRNRIQKDTQYGFARFKAR